MFRAFSLAAVSSLLLISSTPALAQETETKEEAVQPQPAASFFSETTVTATGTKRDTFEVATPVTVINERVIEQKRPQNAADLLREQPGVDVNGVGPNQMRPVIRAQRGLRVLFLENGLRLNNARRQTDFGEISGLVDLDSVKTMEVVRGPASVLYGSDAIGGVLNLVSRETNTGEPFHGFVDLSWAGAGNRRRGGLSLAGSTGPMSYQFGASMREADNYEAPRGSFGAINLPRSTEVLDSGAAETNAWGSVGYAVNDRNMLRLRLSHYDADDTGFGYLPGEQYGVVETAKVRILYPTQTFDRATLSFSNSTDRNPLASSTNVQVYYQRNKRELVNDIDINIGPIRPGFPNSSVEIDTLNFTNLTTGGLRADAVKLFGGGRHTLTYGVEAFRDRSRNTDFSTTVTRLRFNGPPFNVVDTQIDAVANAPNATNMSSGIFVQDEIMVMPRLRVTAGARFQQVETKAQSTPGFDISGLDFEDRNTVGAVTATYQVIDALNVFASYGSAFRAPNIIERLFNGPTPEGTGFQILNARLSSETSRNVDLGLKYRRANAFMEVVGFRNKINDGIIQDFLSPADIAGLPEATRAAITASRAQFVVQQVNSDRLKYEGVELAIGYHFARGLTIGGNHTHINSSRLGGTAILPPDDAYRDKTFGYLRYELAERCWIEYNARRNGSSKVNVDPDEPAPPIGRDLPSFTVQNLGIGSRLFEAAGLKHDVTVWVDNLTDRLYAEFANASFFRPEAGRTLRVSYRVGF